MTARAHIWVAALSTVLLTGAAVGARAESPNAGPPAVTADALSGHNAPGDPTRWIAQPKRSFQWDQKGHWGLKLDMSQPDGRDLRLGDVQAGAYYRVTPSLRVGGGVALGDTMTQPYSVLPQTQAPRVRLETSFKF